MNKMFILFKKSTWNNFIKSKVEKHGSAIIVL